MGQYSAATIPNSIAPGDAVTVWNAEQPAIGAGGVSASLQVALASRDGHSPGFGVNGFFSAAPGAFEIDVQVSDHDVDAQYQTVANGNITTVDSTNQSFHFDGSLVTARFARLLMRLRGNAVNVTADITKS